MTALTDKLRDDSITPTLNPDSMFPDKFGIIRLVMERAKHRLKDGKVKEAVEDLATAQFLIERIKERVLAAERELSEEIKDEHTEG